MSQPHDDPAVVWLQEDVETLKQDLQVTRSEVAHLSRVNERLMRMVMGLMPDKNNKDFAELFGIPEKEVRAIKDGNFKAG